MKIVNIYTDGACSGNQNEENVGGWGCILEYAGVEKELCGGEVNTTNNRMELTALIEALSALKEGGLALRIYSDSSYLVNCFRNRWYEGWQKNGWKNSQKKPVENRELWERLLALLAPNTAQFYLVKGHQKLKEGGAKANAPAFKHYKEQNPQTEGPCFGAQDENQPLEKINYRRFAGIVEYNCRCDALANVYINENRRPKQNAEPDGGLQC